jgi:rubrerythrin
MEAATQERIKALEVAINNETREAEFYRKHSERTTDPLGKRMFISLAHDEREHMERIQMLHKRLQQQGRWPDDVPIQVKGTRVKEVLKSAVESVDRLSRASRDDLEAVRIAIEFEAKGEAFYKELEAKTDNPMEKEFFRFLSSMEHDHLVSLKDSLEYFKNPEGWFTAKERHGLDGGP